MMILAAKRAVRASVEAAVGLVALLLLPLQPGRDLERLS